MKQIVLDQPTKFRAVEVDRPERPSHGEALVRVCRIGICGTDLHAYRGRQPFFTYPRVLGHELGVEVVEVGPGVAGIAKGDLCAVEPYLSCGNCIACRNGKTNCCVELLCLGVHTDGGMKEYLRVPANKLHKSTKLSVDQLALVETLGIGAHAVSRGAVKLGEWVLVVGAGPIGLATIQFAQAAGGSVVVMDTNEQRLEFCRTQIGVQYVVDAKRDPLEQVAAISSKDLPTVVFDCTGNREAMMNSFQFVAHGGRLVFVGLVLGEISFDDPKFHRKELTLLASRNSTGDDFKRIIKMLEVGTIDIRPWITHRCRFDAMIGEFPRWLEPATGVIKAMVEL